MGVQTGLPEEVGVVSRKELNQEGAAELLNWVGGPAS